MHPVDPAVAAKEAGRFVADAAAPKRKRGKQKKPQQARAPPPKLAFTQREFCEAHNISLQHFFQLKKKGLGPAEMHVGARRLISVEAAAEWRAANTRSKELDNVA